MTKVFVMNRSKHDFSAAEHYGELVFLTNGIVNRYATSNIARMVEPELEKSSPNDYLLITSLNVMNVIATAIFVLKHRRLNLLIHVPMTNSYIERKLCFA